MFQPMAREAFAAFHEEFHGDTWDVCARCGGKCEIHRIGSLMPGEAEYIAEDLGIDLRSFRDTYLDGIKTPFGIVDVLKLRPGCPFLSADFRCTIPDVKVVLCDVYPVVFEVHGDIVEFSLDPWCPIVRFVPELARIIERTGIPAIRNLGAPADWYRAVESYDDYCFDYNRLYARRAGRSEYVELTLDDVLRCQADESGLPSLGPSARRVAPCSKLARVD